MTDGPSLSDALECLARCRLSRPGDPFGDERDNARSTRIFISGPMSGHPEFNFTAFKDAASALRARGYIAENPSATPGGEGMVAGDRMTMMQMLVCGGVALLPGWERSPGAKLEEQVGRRFGLAVHPIDEWLA